MWGMRQQAAWLEAADGVSCFARSALTAVFNHSCVGLFDDAAELLLHGIPCYIVCCLQVTFFLQFCHTVCH